MLMPVPLISMCKRHGYNPEVPLKPVLEALLKFKLNSGEWMERERSDLIVRTLFMIILSLNILKASSQEAYKLFLVKREALTN